MTTRKLFRLVSAAATLVVLAGCATPGPIHVYTLAAPSAATIADHSAEARNEVPSFLADDDIVIGFAYDPFTDHFFLRLAPGDRIRVVDRPARAIKREFNVSELADGSTISDLAVRPRDGHIFAPHPRDSALVEFTRLGKYVRTIPLAGFTAPPVGVALDLTRDRLLTLRAKNSLASLQTHTLTGELLGELPLPAASSGSIGYDSETRELYAPLAHGAGIGVFDEAGQLRRTLPASGAFVDIGPRSFIRVF